MPIAINYKTSFFHAKFTVKTLLYSESAIYLKPRLNFEVYGQPFKITPEAGENRPLFIRDKCEMGKKAKGIKDKRFEERLQEICSRLD